MYVYIYICILYIHIGLEEKLVEHFSWGLSFENGFELDGNFQGHTPTIFVSCPWMLVKSSFHQTWKTKRSFLETTNHGAMMLSSFDQIHDSWFTSILNTSHILQGAKCRLCRNTTQTSTKVCRNATKNSLQNSRNTAWGSNFGSEIGKSQDKSPVLLPPFKKRNYVNHSTVLDRT